jgi:hypothetical protein
MVYGGFVSFALSDSLQSSANGGGGVFAQDYKNTCIMLQAGPAIGKSELFNNSGMFNDYCLQKQSLSGIKIYPNPGYGKYTVEGKDIESFEVMNYLGQQIIRQENVVAESGVFDINIKESSEGNYYIKLYKNDGSVVVKPIIKINN